MSPIGRVFIVLNLALAGTFVGFAGTYLQHQDNYKELLAEAQTDAEEAKSLADAQITKLTDEKNDLERQKISLNQSKNALETDNSELSAENASLKAQLAGMGQNLQSLAAAQQATAQQVEAAFEKANQSEQLALDAVKARDEALRTLTAAQSEISEKERNIADLQSSGNDQTAQIADLQRELRNATTLLDAARLANPGLFANLTTAPPVNGTVTDSKGRKVTLVAEAGEASADKFKGAQVGIWGNDGYHGEVVISDALVEGDRLYLFGDVMLTADGKSIQIGDRATN